MVNDPTHLHGPLGPALAPNGDLAFVAEMTVEPTNAGAAFGLAVEPVGNAFRFAAVDDFQNTLDLWTVP